MCLYLEGVPEKSNDVVRTIIIHAVHNYKCGNAVPESVSYTAPTAVGIYRTRPHFLRYIGVHATICRGNSSHVSFAYINILMMLYRSPPGHFRYRSCRLVLGGCVSCNVSTALQVYLLVPCTSVVPSHSFFPIISV